MVQSAIKLCDAHANDNVAVGETRLGQHASRLNRANREDLSLARAAKNVWRAVCESQVGVERAPDMRLVIPCLHPDENRDGDKGGHYPAGNLDGASFGHTREAAQRSGSPTQGQWCPIVN